MSGRETGGGLGDEFQLSLFRALAAHVEGYVNCIDRQRRILFLNRTLSRDLSDILGKRIDDFVTPQHREETIACVERAFASREPQHFEFPVMLADGKRLHLLTRVVPFTGPRGEELALQITTDITERRRLAEELEQSMEFRRRVVENLPDTVALMNRERRLMWINRVPPHLKAAEVIGNTLEPFVSPEGLRKAHAAIDSAFESATIENYEIEAQGIAGSGASYAVRVVPMMSDGKVENVLLISTDITQRKLAERALREKDEQLHRAQRLETVGQLAGGIAHDFNNLLQVIEGNLSFVKENLQNGEGAIDDLEQAMRATERAGELTSHLLAIGRRSRVAPQRVVLGALVEQGMRMLRRVIPENVKLIYEAPSSRYFVDLDPPQFEQVLINLCVNARDAMPSGGTVTIRIDPDGEHHVVMTVTDTGTGIAPENIGRVFEPFFTTKGAGSGLGLAVAAGIIGAHGGDMTAESDGQSWTIMKVRLPRVAAVTQPPAPAPAGAIRGTGVILVAEDEDLVRAQVERFLARAGYTVLQANNGARAVELFRQHWQSVDLVLLDVIMPELDGWQAFQAMSALKPTVKVLFTTGYAASVLPADFAACGARLLSKPYKRQQLLTQIHDMLNQATSP
jgi:two-component system, cell cycle sensor histidine kinase and response regulator CckA